jgi:outer membrane biosynthesis protein TonB
VNGKLIHSEQQCGHGYLDTHHDEDHTAAVKQAVENLLAGKNAELPEKREDSQIKAEKLKKQQQNDEREKKKKDAEEAVKRKKQEEEDKKKAEAEHKKKSEEEAKKKKAAECV